MIYHLTGIEPEPWTTGEIMIGRKNGKAFGRLSKPESLRAFQEAVKEEFPAQNPHAEMLEGDLQLTFWLWRSTAERRQRADATNCQKALEDALQGILYKNDRSVRDVRCVVVEQEEGTYPHIIIEIKPYTEAIHPGLPENPLKMTDGGGRWDPGEEDLF